MHIEKRYFFIKKGNYTVNSLILGDVFKIDSEITSLRFFPAVQRVSLLEIFRELNDSSHNIKSVYFIRINTLTFVEFMRIYTAKCLFEQFHLFRRVFASPEREQSGNRNADLTPCDEEHHLNDVRRIGEDVWSANALAERENRGDVAGRLRHVDRLLRPA